MDRYAQNLTLTGARRFASRLTPQEEEIIRVSFDSFKEEDVTQNGKAVVDPNKLMDAFVKIDCVGDMHDIQLLIQDVDENGDNQIDEQEWRHIMSKKFLGEDDDSSTGHVFAMLDDNKDGYIPLVEFRKMLMQEGQAPLSEQEVDELLMFADADSDGLINYRNFLLWLSNPEVYHKDKADQKEKIRKTMAGGAIGGPGAGAGGGRTSQTERNRAAAAAAAGKSPGGAAAAGQAAGSPSGGASGGGLGMGGASPGGAASPSGKGAAQPTGSAGGKGPAASPKGKGAADSGKGTGGFGVSGGKADTGKGLGGVGGKGDIGKGKGPSSGGQEQALAKLKASLDQVFTDPNGPQWNPTTGRKALQQAGGDPEAAISEYLDLMHTA